MPTHFWSPTARAREEQARIGDDEERDPPEAGVGAPERDEALDMIVRRRRVGGRAARPGQRHERDREDGRAGEQGAAAGIALR
jgi:hypothetical protein